MDVKNWKIIPCKEYAQLSVKNTTKLGFKTGFSNAVVLFRSTKDKNKEIESVMFQLAKANSSILFAFTNILMEEESEKNKFVKMTTTTTTPIKNLPTVIFFKNTGGYLVATAPWDVASGVNGLINYFNYNSHGNNSNQPQNIPMQPTMNHQPQQQEKPYAPGASPSGNIQSGFNLDKFLIKKWKQNLDPTASRHQEFVGKRGILEGGNMMGLSHLGGKLDGLLQYHNLTELAFQGTDLKMAEWNSFNPENKPFTPFFTPK